MERVNWNQAVRPSTHDLIAAINSGADDIERIDGALDVIETALDGKAGVSGTYPDFVAGEALSIRSGIRSNTFLSRALDSDVADGIAEVSRILGNTVVWNQLVKNGGFAAVSDWSKSACDYTVSGGVAEITPTGAAYGRLYQNYVTLTQGHKYYYCVDIKKTAEIALSALILTGLPTVRSAAAEAVNEWVRYEVIGTYSSASITNGIFYICDNQQYTGDGATAIRYARNAMLIDLTTAFGAGNEPTFTSAFRLQYPKGYYPYSAPTLLSSHIAGIQGASACEFPAQTLRGIGTAQDVMTKAGIERVIATAILDGLNDFNWISGDTANANLKAFYVPQNTWIAKGYQRPVNILSQVRCQELETKNNGFSAWTTPGISLWRDNSAALVVAVAENITTVADFKTWLRSNNLHIVYEAYEHTTETFAEPIDLTYSVEADGTEAWIVPDGTAPTSAAVTGKIGYPLDPARALITHESFADFIDKLGAYIGATITETWDGSKYTYSFASGRSALLGSIEAEPDALEVTEKDDIVKEIIEDERKEQ